MIDENLRLKIPAELLWWETIPQGPFDFAVYADEPDPDEGDDLPNGELRLPAKMHDWLIDHRESVRIDRESPCEALIFADRETAAVFWLMFGDDFCEVVRERERRQRAASVTMAALLGRIKRTP
ncbi:hypothetical protein VH570_16640 [Sphingobium sp. HT1-2]|jgi:hypothetical protein|uniref:hypothetical protein n=1 Tax=Sphingobium TaxID=165695 RepID=UPI00241E1214|nr:hypothetical protein [Sphingobium yanoikuyae]